MNSILLVDDEPKVLASLKRALMEEDMAIFTAATAEAGFRIMESREISLVVSDEKMPGMSGTEFLFLVRRQYPNSIRIVLTGHASLDSVMSAVNNGEIYRFFTKPWDDLHLRLTIRAALEKYELEAENRRLVEMVRRHERNVRALEKTYPGISRLEKDEQGMLVIP